MRDRHNPRWYSPIQTLQHVPPGSTRHGYTNHQHHNTGDGDIGLIDMNARYYLPGLARFASPDTLTPDPANPQALNRYTYTLNNPLIFTDPSGHCAAGDTACWILADELYTSYGWELGGLGSHGTWTVGELETLLDAATKIELWFARLGGGDYRGRRWVVQRSSKVAWLAKLSC